MSQGRGPHDVRDLSRVPYGSPGSKALSGPLTATTVDFPTVLEVADGYVAEVQVPPLTTDITRVVTAPQPERR